MADIQQDQLDALVGRSLITVEVIAAELRRRLVAIVSADETLQVARSVLEEFEPILAQAMTDAEIAAWIIGTNVVADRLPIFALEEIAVQGGVESILTDSLPIVTEETVLRFPMAERAAESLVERDIVTRAEFDLMSDFARSRAFTVAFQDTEDAIETIRDVLQEQLETTTSLRSFRKKLDEALEGSRLGPAHAETVYRTNVQSAFHRAHDDMASNPIVEAVFPYQSYLPILDDRTRVEHANLESLGLDGTNVYRRNDPFWDVFTPPWGYNCRCGVNLLTVEAASRAGVREAQEWHRTGVPPSFSPSRLPGIPFRPEDGFTGARQRSAVAGII